MVTGELVFVFNGDMGGSVDCHCNGVDDRRCPLSLLQSVCQKGIISEKSPLT